MRGRASPARRCRLLVVATFATGGLVATSASPAAEPAWLGDGARPRTISTPRAQWSAGGEVSAFLSSRIDYVGVFRVRALIPSRAGDWHLLWQNVVPVLSTSGRGELIIDNVDYQAELGVTQRGTGVRWTPFVRGRGSENVDRPGSAQVLLAGLRAGRQDPQGRLDWELEAAAVVVDSGLEARGSLGARGEWRWLRRARWETGLRAAWDGLWLEGPRAVRADASAGPFLRLRRPGGLEVSAHAIYLRGRHPLGLEDTGVLAGVQFSDAGTARRAEQEAGIEAALAAGGGNDRTRAQQSLELLSAPLPAAGQHWRFRLLADNVLIDARQSDLYYILEGGLERVAGPLRAGIDLHHRSGHLLGELNNRRLSVNILEMQLRSPGWHPDLPDWLEKEGGLARLSCQFGAGRVLSSEFGEHQRWSLRGGARWSLPGAYRRLAPFVGVRAARGEIRGWSASAGVHTPSRTSVVLAAERDSQKVDHRDTSWTVSLGRRF